MKCDESEDLILEYLDGALSESGRMALEGHLAACSACAQALVAHRSLDRMLSAQFQPLQAPEQFAKRLMERAGRMPERRTRLGLLVWLDLAGYGAIAVAVPLALRLALQSFGITLQPPGSGLSTALMAGSVTLMLWVALSLTFDLRLRSR